MTVIPHLHFDRNAIHSFHDYDGNYDGYRIYGEFVLLAIQRRNVTETEFML